MIKCSTHKKVFVSHELAEEALIQTHIQFDYPKGGGPIAVYPCEDCGYFHLTSKGNMNERLSQEIKNGKIHQQKEASHWLGKLKR
jgi:hypothetical protein